MHPMNSQAINQELDLALRDGPVKDIVIPPCPQLLVQLQAELALADPSPEVVAEIAGSDVAMTAALIRIANSPLYARRSLAMAHIAQQLYSVDVEVAKTCGLFFHVGIPVMLQGVKGYRGTLVEAMARQDRSFVQTENANHRTDHAVVGAIVARTWRLPQVIAHAVRLHHDYAVLGDARVSQEVRFLVAIAAVAEHLVAGHEGVTEQREWQTHGATCLALLQIGEPEVEEWVDALYPAFEGVVVA